MIGSTSPSISSAPPQPLTVNDAVARAIVQSLLDSDLLGIAILRAGDWVHVMTNAAYDAILAEPSVVGRTRSDVPSLEAIPKATFEAVMSTGRSVRLPNVLLPAMPATSGEEPSPMRRYVTFTLVPVRALGPEGGGVLVLARDSSEEVHEGRMADLFLLLARDMTAERDEAATIRSAVQHAKDALGATAASIFLIGPDGRQLHGALVGWDWTRTSFVADLEQWPNVARAISRNEPCHFTSASAAGAEEGWFERRGIQAAVCAPMAVDGRVVGVLFFDYAIATEPAVDLALAKTVADQCALLVERAAAGIPRP